MAYGKMKTGMMEEMKKMVRGTSKAARSRIMSKASKATGSLGAKARAVKITRGMK